jgi:TRAP transporter TAXI family solute receptor
VVSKLRLLLLVLALVLMSACGAAPATPPAASTAAADAATQIPAAATAVAPTAAAVATEIAPTVAAAATAVAPTVAAAATAVTGGAGAAVAGQGACTPEAAAAAMPEGKLRMVIGTGGTGGVFFPYGGGLARILTEKLADAEATAEETGGSVDNMKLVGAGEADIGFSTVDSAYDAVNGQGAYQDTGPIPACTIAVLYTSFVHVVASEASGINTVADMKGKRISVGSAGSSTEGAADRVLEAAGLDPQVDITRDNLSVAESVAAMKDQKIDAFFWIGGLPTAAVTDLVSTPNLAVKFIPTAEYVDAIVAKYGPVYRAFDLPPGTYAGFDEPVPGIGIGNIIFVNAAMPEPQVHAILTAIFDNLAEVQEIHPEAKKLTLETAAVGSSIPFHPGAVRFFTERGVWQP